MIDYYCKKVQFDEVQVVLLVVLEQIDCDGISQDGVIIFIVCF